jgi:S-layer protein (TIGR01567 family)
MKKVTAITLTAFVLLLASAMAVSAVDRVEIRGPVANVENNVYIWGSQDFAGFYYDIDDNLGNEKITMTITNGNELSGDSPYGVVYSTQAEPNDFEFEKWGQFSTIGFLSENYFAGYVDEGKADMDQYLFYKSDDEVLLNDEQLSKVLYDDDTERTVTTNSPLKLMEGYELNIQAIDLDGNKVYVQLMKDGKEVNSAVVSPSKDNPTMADETYTYKKDLGDTKKIVVIAVHFKNAFRGADQDLATVNGIWQISDTVTDVEADTEYDKMTIETVDAATMTIEMNNQDSKVTLSKNKDILLMEDIRIKTADQDDVSVEEPLRFYIYKEATIEAETAVEPTPEPVVAPEPVAVEPAPAAEAPAVEEPVAEANVTEEQKVEEKATEEEQKAEEKTGIPGFEAVFAITGLLAVSYLVLRKRE